jgi:hypothetical protein
MNFILVQVEQLISISLLSVAISEYSESRCHDRQDWAL